MTNLTEKISKYRGKIIGIGTALAITGLTCYGIKNSLKNPEYDSDCETYRGYYHSFGLFQEGEINYVFDPRKREDRGCPGIPKHTLTSDTQLTEILKIGKKYSFVFEKPRWPWSSEKLVSFQPASEKSERDSITSVIF